MTRTVKLLTALTVPAALLASAGAAEARPGGRPLMKRLLRTGAITPADLQGVRAAQADLRACRQAVRGGAAPRGACVQKHVNALQARRALLQRALPNVRIDRLRMRVNRALRQTDRQLQRIQMRAARGMPPGAMPPPPPPAR